MTTDPQTAADWYEAGCARDCSEQHTYAWGRCALAPESAKPEPTISVGRVETMSDGYPGIVMRSVPLSAWDALITVAKWVSRGKSFALDADPEIAPCYPDASARRALGALHEAGLLDQPATPAVSPLPDQTLRDRIAAALEQADYRPDMRRGDLADAIMPVLHSLTLRELEQLARPNTPPSRPEPRIPDHTVNEEEAPAPVRQRADCTELEWAEQERGRFERLYTREPVRADLAEQRADTAARDADIYQQRLERLSDGYTKARKRAEEAEAHRLALSEALGLGTGAPWDAIHERATELGLPPLAEDPVAQRLGLVPEPADRGAVLDAAAQHLYTALFPAVYNDLGQKAAEGVNRAVSELRRLATEAQQPAEADTDPDPWHDDPKANTQEADLDRPQDRP